MNTPDTGLTFGPGLIEQIPIEALQPDPHQPRVAIPPESLASLAIDIGARGIEQPIVIRADYTIKDGERRWRAAQIAGLTTVPCIVAVPVSGETADVDWRLDQVADNHHREPLNALDWARVLREMVEERGMAVKDLPALLARRGITMSRPYISNLIRLNDLPNWAKDRIASGVLPPAAGKYVLMTGGHAPAQEKLRKLIDEEAKRLEPGEPIRGNLDWLVRSAFNDTATRLNHNYGDDSPRFNFITSCKGCTNRAQIDGFHFCLDRPCFDEKQSTADAKTKPNGVNKKTVARLNKLSATEAAEKRKRLARTRARETAITCVLADAEKNDLTIQDRRTIAKAMVREMQIESLKNVFVSRGWEPKKERYGHNYHIIADRQIDKLSDSGTDGLLLECALRGNLNVGYYSAGVDHLAIIAKRHRVDLEALEKSALAELKKPKPAAKPQRIAKRKKGKSKS